MLKDPVKIGAYYVTENEGIVRVLKQVEQVGELAGPFFMGRSEYGDVFYWNARGSAVRERTIAGGAISYEPPDETIRCSGDLVEEISEEEAGVAIQDESESTEQRAYHWLVVGFVSPAARAVIVEKGGQVRDLSDDPPLVAVALAYDPAGVWSWSRGEQQHRTGVEFWSHGYLEEASTSLMLQYGAATGGSPEYASVIETYLVLPDEDFDAQTRQVREGEQGTSESQLFELVLPPDNGGDPFLPDFNE